MIDQEKIESILQSLTLEEKASLCSGLTSWTTKPIEDKGVPSVFMADGPTGLRKEDPEHAAENGGPTVKATCFPTEATLACSWDAGLTRAVGEAIGAECRAQGVTTLLAPGVNIKRSPLCGRNFEYYSEDPLLSGKMAVGFIQGLKRQGVGCSLKHFAANSQETLRMSISSEVDERALHELYLRAFEIAVKEAAPSTVMCSYNRINGVYSADNRALLTDILRDRWGYGGLVMSDWGAVNDRAAGIRAGLDLEMPGNGGANDRRIVDAVKSENLTEQELDRVVRRVLRFVLEAAGNSEPVPCDADAGHLLAVRALEQSAVLLKNEGALPLKQQERILFVGQMARFPRYQGGGSSIVNARRLESPLDAAKRLGYKVRFAMGWAEDQTGKAAEKLCSEAVAAAGDCDKIVLFLGLTDDFENEGMDREHLSLPQMQAPLVAALAQTGKKLVVVLSCGSPVELPWLEQTDALLGLYLGGEGVGEAACRLLWGEACPCGKLAETWPLRLEDTPAFHHYPMGPRYVSYNESIFVGYRYYDTAKKPVLFPFGYGMSYTSFAYSDLQLPAQYDGSGAVVVSFSVTNTGSRAGAEICQCYLHREGSAAFQPEQELVGFAKVLLEPGETKRVSLTLSARSFAFYSVAAHDFVFEGGRCELRVGASSRSLPLCGEIELLAAPVEELLAYRADSAYGRVRDNSFPTEQFLTLHPTLPKENRAAKPGEFGCDSTLEELSVTRTGRILRSIARRVGKKTIRFSDSPELNKKLIRRMTSEFPVKNAVLMSGGRIDYETAQALLDVCNGKGGRIRLLRGIKRAMKEKK